MNNYCIKNKIWIRAVAVLLSIVMTGEQCVCARGSDGLETYKLAPENDNGWFLSVKLLALIMGLYEHIKGGLPAEEIAESAKQLKRELKIDKEDIHILDGSKVKEVKGHKSALIKFEVGGYPVDVLIGKGLSDIEAQGSCVFSVNIDNCDIKILMHSHVQNEGCSATSDLSRNRSMPHGEKIHDNKALGIGTEGQRNRSHRILEDAFGEQKTFKAIEIEKDEELRKLKEMVVDYYNNFESNTAANIQKVQFWVVGLKNTQKTPPENQPVFFWADGPNAFQIAHSGAFGDRPNSYFTFGFLYRMYEKYKETGSIIPAAAVFSYESRIAMAKFKIKQLVAESDNHSKIILEAIKKTYGLDIIKDWKELGSLEVPGAKDVQEGLGIKDVKRQIAESHPYVKGLQVLNEESVKGNGWAPERLLDVLNIIKDKRDAFASKLKQVLEINMETEDAKRIVEEYTDIGELVLISDPDDPYILKTDGSCIQFNLSCKGYPIDEVIKYIDYLVNHEFIGHSLVMKSLDKILQKGYANHPFVEGLKFNIDKYNKLKRSLDENDKYFSFKLILATMIIICVGELIADKIAWQLDPEGFKDYFLEHYMAGIPDEKFSSATGVPYMVNSGKIFIESILYEVIFEQLGIPDESEKWKDRCAEMVKEFKDDTQPSLEQFYQFIRWDFRTLWQNSGLKNKILEIHECKPKCIIWSPHILMIFFSWILGIEIWGIASITFLSMVITIVSLYVHEAAHIKAADMEKSEWSIVLNNIDDIKNFVFYGVLKGETDINLEIFDKEEKKKIILAGGRANLVLAIIFLAGFTATILFDYLGFFAYSDKGVILLYSGFLSGIITNISGFIQSWWSLSKDSDRWKLVEFDWQDKAEEFKKNISDFIVLEPGPGDERLTTAVSKLINELGSWSKYDKKVLTALKEVIGDLTGMANTRKLGTEDRIALIRNLELTAGFYNNNNSIPSILNWIHRGFSIVQKDEKLKEMADGLVEGINKETVQASKYLSFLYIVYGLRFFESDLVLFIGGNFKVKMDDCIDDTGLFNDIFIENNQWLLDFVRLCEKELTGFKGIIFTKGNEKEVCWLEDGAVFVNTSKLRDKRKLRCEFYKAIGYEATKNKKISDIGRTFYICDKLSRINTNFADTELLEFLNYERDIAHRAKDVPKMRLIELMKISFYSENSLESFEDVLRTISCLQARWLNKDINDLYSGFIDVCGIEEGAIFAFVIQKLSKEYNKLIGGDKKYIPKIPRELFNNFIQKLKYYYDRSSDDYDYLRYGSRIENLVIMDNLIDKESIKKVLQGIGATEGRLFDSELFQWSKEEELWDSLMDGIAYRVSGKMVKVVDASCLVYWNEERGCVSLKAPGFMDGVRKWQEEAEKRGVSLDNLEVIVAISDSKLSGKHEEIKKALGITPKDLIITVRDLNSSGKNWKRNFIDVINKNRSKDDKLRGSDLTIAYLDNEAHRKIFNGVRGARYISVEEAKKISGSGICLAIMLDDPKFVSELSDDAKKGTLPFLAKKELERLSIEVGNKGEWIFKIKAAPLTDELSNQEQELKSA